MKVICTRNNAEFELVSKDGDDITLKDLNSGKERIVNRKSYERFYKEVEEEVVEEVEDLEEEETEEEVDEEASEDSEEEEVEDADEDAVEDCEEEDEEFEEEPEPVKPVKRGTKKAEAKKEPKPKKEKKVTIVKAAGCTIFVTRVKGFHTIKLDGHMCMAFTFSTKGIVLWLRTKALDGLNIEYKTMKHMFDARISLTEDNEKTANLIRKCVAASVEYQKGVNTRKAQKAEALEAARQKKLEKEEKKKEAIAEKLGVKPKKAAKKASKKVETPEVEAEALEDEEE